MKKCFSLLFFILFSAALFAQEGMKIVYLRSNHDKIVPDQDPILLEVQKNKSHLTSERIQNKTATYPYEEFFMEWEQGTPLYTKVAHLSEDEILMTRDTSYKGRYQYDFKEDRREILGYICKKAVCVVNSNTIELWYTDEVDAKGSPVEMGNDLGLVLEYVRNGNTKITAQSIDKSQKQINVPDSKLTDALTYQDAIWKSRFIQIPVFNDEIINFVDSVKSDSILRFAQGTVILKKIFIPKLTSGTQGFIQLIEKSRGDAYDRTGSVFLISEDTDKLSFIDGMKQGMSSLPAYENGNGKVYRGMVSNTQFTPSIELMRFFTPFGVSYFNDRLTLKGKTWQDSVLYRQDISEFVDYLSGKSVYIGVYIGNYDKGGHEVSLEMTFHPGWDRGMDEAKVLPLFNTTNVMEMGGQEYPTLFNRKCGLKVRFNLDEDASNVRLRYITTGHGGWGKGDEFVPKENTIYLNGQQVHKFVPWRVDCGSYRLYNPVSGNFVNGLSSSDLSRSNWCPGTVTSPVFISLGDMKAGEYEMEVDIPQGEPEGSSFSYWNVSGLLIYN